MSSYMIVWARTYPEDDRDRGEEVLHERLKDKVEAFMAQGWSCIGGVAIVHSDGEVYKMYQTMIRVPV